MYLKKPGDSTTKQLFTFSFPLKTVIDILARTVGQEIKDIQIVKKKKNQISHVVKHNSLTEEGKYFMTESLQLTKEFSIAAEYKVRYRRLQHFYTPIMKLLKRN